MTKIIALLLAFLVGSGLVWTQGVGATTSLADWSTRLGVSVDRLEACPGESLDNCVHIKDGPIVSVTIPSGFKYEGWDGSKNVSGQGPASLQVAGLTVRASTPSASPTPTPSSSPTPTPVPSSPPSTSPGDFCPVQSMVLTSMRPISGTGLIVVDVGMPQGFNALVFDGQEMPGGVHVYRIFGLPVTGWPIAQGTWYAVCSGDVGSMWTAAAPSGSEVWDMRVSPPAKLK